MSKIEKALQKARQQSTQPGKSLDQPRHRPDRTAPTRPEEKSELPVEISSREAIALMHEPSALSADERLLRKIIVREAISNPTVKALRHIRTRISQKMADGNAVIMVTGIEPGSGGSFTAVNLAAAFALDTAKTALLIDCNIHKPILHDLAADRAAAGLTDYLTGLKTDVAEIIQPTGIERLRVIPAGAQAHTGVEYFSMEKMRRLIRSLRDRYADRQIILDCPPMARSADAQLLMELSDFAVLVVPYGGVTESQLQAALKLIDARKFLGVIINDEPLVPAFDKQAVLSFKNLLSNLLSKRKNRPEASENLK